jgi:hypothetical protein
MLKADAEVEKQSSMRQEFWNLVFSMTESFNSMTPDGIAHRLPEQPFCGHVKEDVNVRPISDEAITGYNNELEHRGSSSSELTIERIEDTEKGIQSGIIGNISYIPLPISLSSQPPACGF